MGSRLYVARLEVEGGMRNLVITINDRESDCNLGWDTDRDADIWLQIGKLWIAAPALLAALEAVEWVRVYGPERDGLNVCPWCGYDDELGHSEDCQRQAAIAKARGDSDG